MNRERSAPGRRRERLIFLVKVLVSSGLIWFVVSRLSLAEIRRAMGGPDWRWLAAALGIYAVSAVGGAWQWALILRRTGVAAPARELVRLYFIGLFFNNFLPANIGGDAYKIIDLGRRENRALPVFCATLLDRLIGLAALTALAVLVMLAAAAAGIPLPSVTLVLLPVLAGLVAIPAVLLSRRLGGRAPDLCRRVGLVTLGERLGRVTSEFGRYRRRVRWLNGLFLLSLGIQSLRMLTHLAVALGLGFALDGAQAVQLLVLIPLLALGLTLPVTINGIGLRESVSANLLTWAGLAAPQAVAMEVAAYLVQVVFSLQGGVLLWLGRTARHDRPRN